MTPRTDTLCASARKLAGIAAPGADRTPAQSAALSDASATMAAVGRRPRTGCAHSSRKQRLRAGQSSRQNAGRIWPGVFSGRIHAGSACAAAESSKTPYNTARIGARMLPQRSRTFVPRLAARPARAKTGSPDQSARAVSGKARRLSAAARAARQARTAAPVAKRIRPAAHPANLCRGGSLCSSRVVIPAAAAPPAASQGQPRRTQGPNTTADDAPSTAAQSWRAETVSLCDKIAPLCPPKRGDARRPAVSQLAAHAGQGSIRRVGT